MSTEGRLMRVSGIPVEVVRKDIKNLHLGVYPPRGRVRVAAPRRLNDDAVRLAVVSRLGWIRRQQAAFARQDRQSKREMLTGESHYFFGRRYRLRVVERPGLISIGLKGNGSIVLHGPPGTRADEREKALQRWYRGRLRDQLPALLAKWDGKVGVSVLEVRIKRMRTRWGSCNPVARRIWLNLELAKKPPACLEYILVHEMVHIRERRHNERFRALLDGLMPNWRTHRELLNRAPLSHEDWKY